MGLCYNGDGWRWSERRDERKNCTNGVMYVEKPDAYEGHLIERKYSDMLIEWVSKPKDSSD